MATVVKSWTFDSDNEGLADAGWAGNITWSWLSSDGSPSNGCLRCVCGYDWDTGERAIKSSTSDTWETWGVPSGATVTNAQISFKFKATSHSGGGYSDIGIISSVGAYISYVYAIDNSDLGSYSTWTTLTGALESIGASYQASTTPVRIAFTLWTGSGEGWSGTFLFDSIDLTITYTGGGGGGGAQIPAAISTEQKQRGHANLRR